MVRNNYTVNLHTYLERPTHRGTIACVKRNFERVNFEIQFVMGRLTNLFKLAVGSEVPLIRGYVRGEEDYVVSSFLDRPNQPTLIKGITSEDPKTDIRRIRTEFRMPRPRKLVGVRRFHSTSFISGKETSLETLWKSKLLGFEGNKELENLVLNALNNKKCNNLSKIMSDPDFLVGCWQRIKLKDGSVTKALSDTTLDGINRKWFEDTASSFQNGFYRFDESRIPKHNKLGAFRSFIRPAPRDKIVQEAMRLLLDLIFELTFRDCSHGFRSNRGCLTALHSIRMRYGHVSWFIEGDIDSPFSSIDHSILVKTISEKVDDQAFIDLIYKYVRVGYGEKGKESVPMKVGLAQEGVLSPLLFNIYMNHFDIWMEDTFIPLFNLGECRKKNPKYSKMIRSGSSIDARKSNLHTKLANDLDFQRLRYTRYADDFVIGVIGSRKDCLTVREEIRKFLKEELRLNLNLEKTKIIHAQSDSAKFLGYKIHITPVNKPPIRENSKGKMIRIASRPLLDAPIDQKVKDLFDNKYSTRDGNPTRNGRLIHLTLVGIVNHYRSVERGILNYYSMANNFGRLAARVHYILKYSCALTVASKMKLNTLRKVFSKYGRDLTVRNEKGDVSTSYPTPSYKRRSDHLYLSEGCTPDNLIKSLSRRIGRGRKDFRGACSACGSLENI